MRLEGKTALVTAAGAGIGRAAALAFAREGAKVYAVDISRPTLESLVQENDEISIEALDVTDKPAVENVLGRISNINVLLNAVGYVHHGSILQCSDENWHKSFGLNVTSMMYLCRSLLPRLVKQGGGSIINVSSVASSVSGLPNRFAYSVTKAAVIGLTKSIATDFVGAGVRCNAICPGTIDTPSLAQRMRESGDEAAARKAFIARQPMGRLGTAEEVAALAVYLAGDESAFTTGAIHVIDGGLSM